MGLVDDGFFPQFEWKFQSQSGWRGSNISRNWEVALTGGKPGLHYTWIEIDPDNRQHFWLANLYRTANGTDRTWIDKVNLLEER